MIQVFLGDEDLVVSHCLASYQKESSAYWMDSDDSRGRRYWAGLRSLLPQFRIRLGDELFEAILSNYLMEASLVLGNLEGRLTDEDRLRRRGIFEGQLDSNLTHNWYIQRPLIDQWGVILRQFLAAQPGTLIIPKLHRVDAPTRAVLKSMYRSEPVLPPPAILGVAPIEEPVIPLEVGLQPDEDAQKTQRIAAPFLVLPESKWTRVTELAATVSLPLPSSAALDPLDDDPESEAWDCLEKRGDPTTEQIDLIVEAMRRAFRIFDIDASLRLGLALLELEPSLSLAQAATVHTIVGLSGHNYQFRSGGNLELAAFLRDHFIQALEAEIDPARRICLLYRLAVTLGRRQSEFEGALDYANRALEELDRAKLSDEQSALLRAWSLNIRAYLYMRLKDSEHAFEDSFKALNLLEETVQMLPEVSRETIYLYTLLPDNLATLSQLTGQPDKMRHWLAHCKTLSDQHIQVGDRFSAPTWIKIHLDERRLDLAIEAANSGLTDARHHLDASRQESFLYQLLDLKYRQGEIAEALVHGRSLQALRERLDRSDHYQIGISLYLATAALKGESPATAYDALQRALALPESEAPTHRAELLGWLARASAQLGLETLAETHINRAISIAVKEGERDGMIRAAQAAGDVGVLLGKSTEALQAYRQGVELLNASEESVDVSDAVALRLGLLDGGEMDSDHLRKVLLAMPEALEDSESWWAIPRLLRHLQELPLPLDDQTENALRDVLAAARQRRDCESWLDELEKKYFSVRLAEA